MKRPILPSRIENGDNGRKADGKFAKGNKIAKGHKGPHAKRRAEITRRLLNAAEDEIDTVIASLVRAAKRGKPWAVKEVLDRCIGRPATEDRREPEEVEADAAARTRLARLLKRADAVAPLRTVPDLPTDEIIEDAAALVALGLPADGLPTRLGIRPAVFEGWIKEGAEAVQREERDGPCAGLYLSTEAAWQEARLGMIVQSRL